MVRMNWGLIVIVYHPVRFIDPYITPRLGWHETCHTESSSLSPPFYGLDLCVCVISMLCTLHGQWKPVLFMKISQIHNLYIKNHKNWTKGMFVLILMHFQFWFQVWGKFSPILKFFENFLKKCEGIDCTDYVAVCRGLNVV